MYVIFRALKMEVSNQRAIKFSVKFFYMQKYCGKMQNVMIQNISVIYASLSHEWNRTH